MPLIKIKDALVEPVSLAEAKVHLREEVEETHLDGYITAIIKVARSTLEREIGRSLIATEWRLVLDHFSPVIDLPMPPTMEVLQVRYLDDEGAQQVMAPELYGLQPGPVCGLLEPAYGTSWPAARRTRGAVSVTFKAGYGDAATDVPAPLVHWIKLALTDLWENRSRSAERPVLPQGFAAGLLTGFEIFRP